MHPHCEQFRSTLFYNHLWTQQFHFFFTKITDARVYFSSILFSIHIFQIIVSDKWQGVWEKGKQC